MSTPEKNSVLEELQNAEKVFNEEELKNNFIVFNDEMKNKVLIGKVISIDYTNKIAVLAITKGKTVIEKKISFKYASLNTQFGLLQVLANDIISIKYLGKKSWNNKEVNSFIAQKLAITNEGKFWLNSKQF